jgi:D-alanyl-D-alanine carboxypeptidase (penicillin-binding protein 5/6)
MHRARTWLALLVAWCAAPSLAQSESPPAAAWLLVRDDTIVNSHNPDTQRPVASLAKLLTALVWVQRPERLDQVVVVSARAASAIGASADLRTGERYRGEDLLNAMLVRSANDACLALAEQAAGSVEAFVADLERAAEALDLHATRFANPCGLDAPQQHSTAREVLAIARAAMQVPELASRVAQREFVLQTEDGERARTLRSTNLLLERLPGTIGVKTGFTAQAGKCLVALVRRDEHEVWLVLLGARERWWTAHRAIEDALRDAPAR